jgi:hypothetical protein
MGLRAFEPEMQCPKCHGTALSVTYHDHVVMGFGEELYPCQEWVQAGLLTQSVTQHLCLRCLRCRYGLPTKTADA